MLILGINGNFSAEGEEIARVEEYSFHDSSASLLRDGELIAAVEEERLNRIKQTTKFPARAVRACLAKADVRPEEIDAVAFYVTEDFADSTLNELYMRNPRVPARYSRELIKERFAEDLGWQLPDEKLLFFNHHYSHALSSYTRSGFDDALVLVADGRGDWESTSVYKAVGGKLEVLAQVPAMFSLGLLYSLGTWRLGYGVGDEYKVMGLAPYGDPAVLRPQLESLYGLLPEGQFYFNFRPAGYHYMQDFYADPRLALRRKGEEFTQDHKDFAAALQEALEKILTHVLEHWAQETGLRKLAFGGGVAHNCSFNGKLLRSGLFDEVFVHPASHDAGAGEGAALAAHEQLTGALPAPIRLRRADLGPDIGTTAEIETALKAWSGLVEFEAHDDVTTWSAGRLAEGAVLGWVQGASEFGPRSLGHRSILADPRPKENQTRINAIVKKRESYRPFAPSVTAEAAADYFEIPETRGNFDFMSFALHVRPDRREELGAVTHVDGTARVQVVEADANPRFHALIEEFGRVTGTPVVLNTSFNNNAEPIVQTVADAVTTFLTTDLDYLVVGDFVVRPGLDRAAALAELVFAFRPVTRLRTTTRAEGEPAHQVYLDYPGGPELTVLASTYELLTRLDGHTRIGDLAPELPAEVAAELQELWNLRFFTVAPA
ncbi:carbamoyltransferase family protein [Amycolatopsis eburnea]|uniref:Carbamoyltransferase n=1 Tax=Amycolatopsis eburnea TaxID=2267691 RepID=A0A427T8N0_9PSEU|nr:carbamoyltransferase C-terminal domain-containing protein [Amycolatopsis eburnea]RSD17102.1 carbamoyltransferase [Amycolatopsis eburnea]